MNRQLNPETGIVHFRVERAGSIRQFLRNADFSPLALEVDDRLVDEWLTYGSVYHDGLRRREDHEVAPGAYLRVHTRRKNYVWNHCDLRTRIVFDHDEFLVFNKPAGLPCHPTLDNYLDNAKLRLERELGIQIFVTHRLDVPTEGLMILAKSARAQALINKAFARREVEKFYSAFCAQAVAPGEYCHYMDPESRVPKRLSLEPRPAWPDCRLQVFNHENEAAGVCHRVRLITGRTHQIRAQFAFLGAPLLGDSVYGSKFSSPWPNGVGLRCEEMALNFRREPYRFQMPTADAR